MLKGRGRVGVTNLMSGCSWKGVCGLGVRGLAGKASKSSRSKPMGSDGGYLR